VEYLWISWCDIAYHCIILYCRLSAVIIFRIYTMSDIWKFSKNLREFSNIVIPCYSSKASLYNKCSHFVFRFPCVSVFHWRLQENQCKIINIFLILLRNTWLIDWLTDWLTDLLTDSVHNWSIYWLIGRMIDWLVCWLIDWLTNWQANYMYQLADLRNCATDSLIYLYYFGLCASSWDSGISLNIG